MAGRFKDNRFSAMSSEDDDSQWGESTDSGFDHSEDEEDSGFSDTNISDVDAVTKFLDQSAKLELEEDLKSAAKSTEDPNLNNKKATEDKMETTQGEEETKEHMDEGRKTEDILPGSCSSNNQVVFPFPFLFLIPILSPFPYLCLFWFPFSFLFAFPFLGSCSCSYSSQVGKMKEFGDSYDADTEDSDSD